MSNFDADAFGAILSPRQRASDLEGSALGNWKLLKKLSSSGGVGIVYKARHTRAEMGDAAVKVFAFDANENPEIRTIFDREIAILKKLTDARDVQGVPRIYDADIESSGLPWIAMQYIDGQPLDKWLWEARLETRRPSKRDVVQILTDILAALATVQQAFARIRREAADPITRPPEAGIVHRDLKPSNVMVESSSSGVRAWVLDFGIARILQPATPVFQMPQPSATTVTTNMLTAEYASPEMLVPRPTVDQCSDIFQVGQIGFELLTGVRYWDAWPHRNSMLTAAKYSWWIKRAVRRALQWDRERRFQSAHQFRKSITHPYHHAAYDNLLTLCTSGILILLLFGVVLLSVWLHNLRSISHQFTLAPRPPSPVETLAQEPTNPNAAPGSLDNRDDESKYIVYLYNRIRDGNASAEDVDDLRDRAGRFLSNNSNAPHSQLKEVRVLLAWLDYARLNGTITVTMKQLQEKESDLPSTTYAMEGVIESDGQRISTGTINVHNDTPVDNRKLDIRPWNPDPINILVKVTERGYECSGETSLSSSRIFQDAFVWQEIRPKGKYQDYFKLSYTIEHNFGTLPPLSQ